MIRYTVAITETVEYLVPVEAVSAEAAEEIGYDLIVSSPDRDKYFVDCRTRECEGVNEGWDDKTLPLIDMPNARLLAMARTLANMTTPTDGLVNRDEAHIEMAMAERSDDALCSDADALYRMIEEARNILDAI